MGSFSNFNSRDGGNEGIKVPLVSLTGENTDEHIVIRSVDSDAFRDAEAEARREAMRAAQVDDIVERRKIARESTTSLHVALVKDWSFDEPCTEENIRDFLKSAPHIADAIDQMAAKRSLFVEKKLQNSSDSQSTKPKARVNRKAAAPRKKPTSNK